MSASGVPAFTFTDPEGVTMSSTAAVVNSPQAGEGQAWWFMDTLVLEHPMASGTGPVVLEMTLPVGAAPPQHVHSDQDDSHFLLEGQMVVRCGDQTRLAQAGDWVSMPRGVPHTFRVVGDRPARILLVHDSDSFLEFIRDVGQPAGARQLPPPTAGPGPAEMSRALTEHDLTVTGSPLSSEEARAFLAEHG
jgi:quercetin dioxygenase-like cupin family protein